MCYTEGQSILSCSLVTPVRIPGGKPAEHPWGAAPAARLRPPERGWDTDERSRFVFW